jgi:methylenetetrahydrofolate--tRNA-(uracil-5-)-methyltransferase
MNVNFGLFPPIEESGGRPARGRDRKQLYSVRALADLDGWAGRAAAE